MANAGISRSNIVPAWKAALLGFFDSIDIEKYGLPGERQEIVECDNVENAGTIFYNFWPFLVDQAAASQDWHVFDAMAVLLKNKASENYVDCLQQEFLKCPYFDDIIKTSIGKLLYPTIHDWENPERNNWLDYIRDADARGTVEYWKRLPQNIKTSMLLDSDFQEHPLFPFLSRYILIHENIHWVSSLQLPITMFGNYTDMNIADKLQEVYGLIKFGVVAVEYFQGDDFNDWLHHVYDKYRGEHLQSDEWKTFQQFMLYVDWFIQNTGVDVHVRISTTIRRICHPCKLQDAQRELLHVLFDSTTDISKLLPFFEQGQYEWINGMLFLGGSKSLEDAPDLSAIAIEHARV
jgi:hypothetical protein